MDWPEGTFYRIDRVEYGQTKTVHSVEGVRCQFLRDADGLITSYWHQAGVQWDLAYNRNGRLTYIGNQDRQYKEIVYNAEGNIDHVISSGGSVLNAEYNALGRLSFVEDGTGFSMINNYDEEGTVLQSDLKMGGITHSTSWSHSEDWKTLMLDGEPVLNLQFDDNGNVIAMKEGINSISIEYNEADQPVRVNGDHSIFSGLFEDAMIKNSNSSSFYLREKWAAVDEEEIASAAWKLTSENYRRLMWDGIFFDQRLNSFRLIWPTLEENDWGGGHG